MLKPYGEQMFVVVKDCWPTIQLASCLPYQYNDILQHDLQKLNTVYYFAAYAPGTSWLFWKLLVVDKCGWGYILHWFFETTLLCCLIDCHTKAHQVLGHMACYAIRYWIRSTLPIMLLSHHMKALLKGSSLLVRVLHGKNSVDHFALDRIHVYCDVFYTLVRRFIIVGQAWVSNALLV